MGGAKWIGAMRSVMRGPVEKFARAVYSEKITCALFMKVQRQTKPCFFIREGPAREGRPVLGFRVLGIPFFVLEREQMLSPLNVTGRLSFVLCLAQRSLQRLEGPMRPELVSVDFLGIETNRSTPRSPTVHTQKRETSCRASGVRRDARAV